MLSLTNFAQSQLQHVAERLHAAADALDPIYLRAKGTSAGDYALDRISRLREAAYRLEGDPTSVADRPEPSAPPVRTSTPEGAATGRGQLQNSPSNDH